jgi:hypothetical protein
VEIGGGSSQVSVQMFWRGFWRRAAFSVARMRILVGSWKRCFRKSEPFSNNSLIFFCGCVVAFWACVLGLGGGAWRGGRVEAGEAGVNVMKCYDLLRCPFERPLPAGLSPGPAFAWWAAVEPTAGGGVGVRLAGRPAWSASAGAFPW